MVKTCTHALSLLIVKQTDEDCNLPSTANLFDDADNQLFRSILANGEHILHHCMPQRTTLSHCRHYLRPRKHNKELIPKTRTLNNKDL